MLRTDDLEYDLPERLIARRPVHPRHDARLFVVSRTDLDLREHARVKDLPSILKQGDLLMRNVSRVVPARLLGKRADTKGKVEGLYLESVASKTHDSLRWRVLLKSNGKLRPDQRIELHAPDDDAPGVMLTLIDRDDAAWVVCAESVDDATHASTEDLLQRIGATPLPPYILGARQRDGDATPDSSDRLWYQTVYASLAAGSVAAPTAGLHFTEELLDDVLAAGVEIRDVILHVGEGTFRPIETDTIEAHPMHTERFEVPGPALKAMLAAKPASRRVLSIGTTTARALESLPHPDEIQDADAPIRGATDILIAPGYEWRWIDGMMTNFHLPRSTLIAMIASLFPEGVEHIKRLYAEAIQRDYRFYSYGDAMLILP